VTRRAALRVPVELTAGGRWFRLADEVGEEGLGLLVGAPDALAGTVAVAFCLPEDPRPIRAHARLEQVVVGSGEGERAERRRVRFLDLSDEDRARIGSYLDERLSPVK
jgi:hypothetical protein